MSTLYPLPPFRPYIQNEIIDDLTDFFQVGINDSGNFAVDNYATGAYVNIYER
jgi:hypothetical protein